MYTLAPRRAIWDPNTYTWLIPLTSGQVAFVDTDDVTYLEQWNWRFEPSDFGNGYAIRGWARKGIPAIRMHRVVAERAGIQFSEESPLVDHVDCNGLNNRRANLRAASRSGNSRNVSTPSHNTSGIKGVSFDTARGKWRAQIRANDKIIFLGRFATEEEAAQAYAHASAQYHGDFSNLG
jgi:hypothetical protein